MFIVVDQPKPEQNKICTREISLLNQLQFKQDTVFINYINYTELFCEVYILRTHLTYHFSLKDIDPAMMRVVEKRYDFGDGIVKEGQPYWFEIQLFAKNNELLVWERDIESKDTKQVASVNLMFKTKQGAKDAMALLRNAINEVNM